MSEPEKSLHSPSAEALLRARISEIVGEYVEHHWDDVSLVNWMMKLAVEFSRARIAGAYEAAVREVEHGDQIDLAGTIRALTPADAQAAMELERLKARREEVVEGGHDSECAELLSIQDSAHCPCDCGYDKRRAELDAAIEKTEREK